MYCGSFGEFRSTRVSVCVVAVEGAGAAPVVMEELEGDGAVLVVMLGFVPEEDWGSTAGWVMSVLSGEVPAVGLAAFGCAAYGSVVVAVLELLSLGADIGLVSLGADIGLVESGAAMLEDGELDEVDMSLLVVVVVVTDWSPEVPAAPISAL